MMMYTTCGNGWPFVTLQAAVVRLDVNSVHVVAQSSALVQHSRCHATQHPALES
jgi:hypothetical protein